MDLVLQVNYPPKQAVVKLPGSTSFADLQAAAVKELGIETKDIEGHDFRAVSLAKDVIPLGKKGGKETLTEAGVINKSLIFLSAPVHLKPQRPKKKKKDEKKDGKRRSDPYKDFDIKTILKTLATAKAKEEKLAYEFVDIYATKIFKLSDFKKLDAKILKNILKRDTLNIKEGDLFDAVVEWGKNEAKDEKASSETLAKILVDILPLVRFPAMSMTEVAAKVTQSGLIPSDLILSLFTYLGTSADNRKSIKMPWPTKARVGRRPPNWFSWDPINKGSAIILSEENLVANCSGGSWISCFGDTTLEEGVHEWELVLDTYDTSNSYNIVVGVIPSTTTNYGSMSNPAGYSGNDGWTFVTGNGQKCNNSYPTTYGTSAGQGAVVRIKVDMDAKTIEFFVNDASQGVAYSNLASSVRPAMSMINNQKVTLRFPTK